MCFSATSSFTVAALLTGVGIISYKHVTNPKQIPLSLIPFGFAIQQSAEGIVWLTLDHPETTFHKIGVYTFLSFAFMIWPLWAPFAVKMYETDHARKMLLSLCQLLGLLFAITAGFLLLTTPISVVKSGGHLAYHIKNSFFGEGSSIGWYLIPTVLPFFVASNPILSLALGSLLSISLAVTYLVAASTLISMWCFLAAIISIFILAVVWTDKRHYK